MRAQAPAHARNRSSSCERTARAERTATPANSPAGNAHSPLISLFQINAGTTVLRSATAARAP